MRVLLADSDADFAAFLSRGLSASGHDLRVARDGRDALFMATDDPFDALVIDRRMPLLDGLSLLKRLRTDGHMMPVIMLSASADLAEKVEGLDAGADDYVIKPVAIAELNARLNAIARRPAALAENGRIRAGTIEADLFERIVRRSGQAIDLAALEFKIVVELLRNVDTVVSRQLLLKRVWGYDEEPKTNIVASQIARIRTKLNIDGHQDAIRTVHGAGYVIYSDV